MDRREKRWYEKSQERIRRAASKAGRMSLRDLKRATHYNRGPEETGIGLWHDALRSVAQAGEIRMETADGESIPSFDDWYGEYAERVWVIWAG